MLADGHASSNPDQLSHESHRVRGLSHACGPSRAATLELFWFLEPMIVHQLQEFGRDGITRCSADDGINWAFWTKRRLPSMSDDMSIN